MVAFTAGISNAQITIFEDFDSYQPGDDIVEVNPQVFEYWPGGNTGIPISDEQAFSGTNSVYLAAPAGGSAQDVVMNFGDVYDSGTASLSFQMFVSEGFGAYYNVQGVDPPASAGNSSWASQVYFDANGTVEFQGANSVFQASAIYPQGEWFEVRYDVNLDENVWELSVDGRCLASYQNTRNSFASFNLFPFARSGDAQFYFDDMRFEHSSMAQEINNDVGLILPANPLGGLEGAAITNVAGMFNIIGETITSAVLEVDYAGTQTPIVLDNINVPVGDTLQINTETPIDLVSGIEEIVVKIRSVNGVEGDDSSCNNNLFSVTTAVQAAPRKGVLIEEATGTWCTWCPRGDVFMRNLTALYGDRFVSIAVHNNDPMAVTEYDTGMTSLPGFTGFPSATVNREFIVDPSGLEQPFLDDVVIAPRGAFEVGANLDVETGDLDISVEVEALQTLNFADNIMVAIIEDEVTGTGSGYDQVNAYAGGGNGPMGGYEDLPSPVPAEDMVYEFVARALVTPYRGQSLDIPTTMDSGTKLQNYRITLDSQWDIENLSIVVALIGSDGQSDNAMKITLADATENGFLQSNVNDPALQASFEIFPNPVADLMNVQLESGQIGEVNLELFNIYGQLVHTEKLQSFVGTQNWLVNVSELQNGMYTARVRIGDKTAVQKIQKFTK